MRTGRVFALAFIVTILVSTVFVPPAYADGKNVTINNKSNHDVVVNFQLEEDLWWWQTPEAFSIEADAGEKGKKKLEQGEYLVTYSHCGVDFDFRLELDDEYTLVLYPCESQPTKIQVKSHLSEKVNLEIFGYVDYSAEILPGIKNRVEVFSGKIDYQYVACDEQVFSGELNVAKNGKTQLVLHSCDWHRDPARNYAKPNLSKFRIVNHASFPIIMTLIGPGNYLVTVDPGINVFTLMSGSYKFNYYQDFKLVTGSFVVTQNGNDILVVAPTYVMEYVDDFEDLE